MSTPFDWGDEEPTSVSSSNSQSFDWGDESAESPKKSISFPKLGFGKKVREENRLPEMKRTLGRTGKVVGSTIAGLPGDVVSQITKGLNWTAEHVPFGNPKSDEELKSFTENPLTSESLMKGVEKVLPDLAPKNEMEREWEDTLSLITSFATPIPGGKAKFARKGEGKALYEAAKRLGLPEKDVAPLLRGEMSSKALAKLSSHSQELKKTLQNSESLLSDVYGNIAEKAKDLPHIHANESIKLMDKFDDIKRGLQDTKIMSEDTSKVIKIIEGFIEDTNNFGITPTEIINSLREINKTVNWNAVKGGKKTLAALKNPMIDTLHSVHPSLANEVKDVNLLWGKLKRLTKALGPENINQFINYTAGSAFLGSLLFGNTDYAKKIALTFAGKKALSKISTKLLTDPKWQNITSKITTSIKNNSPKGTTSILQALKEKVRKEMPEEYEEIEWPE